MARYWEQDLGGEATFSDPPTEPLEGLRPLSRARWESVMRAQDRVPTVSRRLLMQASVGQSRSDWRFVSGAPATGVLVAYATGRARITSGCMPRVSVLYLPSGGVGGDTVTPDLAEGTLRLEVTWTAEDATVLTDTVEIELEASTNTNFDTLAGSGAAFGELRERSITLTPPADLSNTERANRWTPSPTVEIEAFQVGGTRIVDFSVYETPYQVSFESDDTNWTSHVFATSEIAASSQASSNRPRTRRSETTPDGNPRGGTLQTIAVAREQRQRFGPCLLAWGNYQETTSTASVGLQGLQVTGSAANLVNIFDTSLTAYDSTREGLSVSCGGYARALRDTSGHILGTEDAQAAIPVVWRVYGDSSTAVRMRLMTAEHSWVEVELDTTTGWYEGWGWLEVGINGSDTTVAQVFVDGSANVEVLAFQLELLNAD